MLQPISVQACCSVLAIAWIASACGESSPPSSATSSNQNQPATATEVKFDRQILRDFADQVIIPNNNLFAERAQALQTAVDRFAEAPGEQTLTSAQKAWVSARSAWEQTECFTFGPAGSLGYDGALDTWPVNETDFKAMLKSGVKLKPDTVAKMKDTEKGFHVIEYFLFGNDQSRKASDLAQSDLAYVKLLAQDFADVGRNLAASWSKGIEGKPAYREVLATAGESGNTTYPTLEAGAEEMIQGMLDSLDEVANEKMGEAFKKKDPKLAESRFSFNTLADMKSNIQGAQNVYLGSFPDAKTSGKSLSSFVAQANPALDIEVKEQLKVAIGALGNIPDPFEKAILAPKATVAIETAQSAINTVRATVEGKVKPLVVEKS